MEGAATLHTPNMRSGRRFHLPHSEFFPSATLRSCVVWTWEVVHDDHRQRMVLSAISRPSTGCKNLLFAETQLIDPCSKIKPIWTHRNPSFLFLATRRNFLRQQRAEERPRLSHLCKNKPSPIPTASLWQTLTPNNSENVLNPARRNAQKDWIS